MECQAEQACTTPLLSAGLMRLICGAGGGPLGGLPGSARPTALELAVEQ